MKRVALWGILALAGCLALSGTAAEDNRLSDDQLARATQEYARRLEAAPIFTEEAARAHARLV